jgi:SAM-dependent methyltransferase
LSLSDEYQQQRAWRPWPRIFAALPGVAGQTVLDLGCGVGDQAAELTARGARVIGIDTNAELLRAARARVPSARVLLADLAALDLGTTVDGLWGSFVAAYFPVLAPVLATWAALLAPGGWVALTEIDDLFAHEPLPPRTASSLEAFATSALARGRHDFTMGRKLRPLLEAAGFCVQQELELEDRELAFQGAASASLKCATTSSRASRATSIARRRACTAASRGASSLRASEKKEGRQRGRPSRHDPLQIVATQGTV